MEMEIGGLRSSRSDSSRRAFGNIARGTIEKSNDKPTRQEHDLNLHDEETKTQVEYFGHYGFHSVPVDPKDGKYAEALVAFLGGNRSHAVVFATGDRRYKPKDWKPGESGHYDDQGQLVRLTRDGIRLNGGDKKLPVKVEVGDATHTFDKDFHELERGNAKVRVEDGKVTATVGSLSWVLTASRLDLGGTGGSGVMTEAGTSTKVFAVL